MPLPFDAQPLTQDQLIQVIRKAVPPEILDALQRSPNGGYELYLAIAAVGERLATAIYNVEVGSYALHALGGAKAVGTVTFTRAGAPASPMTIKKGTVVGTAQGRNFLTVEDVVIASLATTASIGVEAVAMGWEWNVLGERTTAAGEVLPGQIDRVVTSLTDPAYGGPDYILSVKNAASTTGGRAPMLDAVAEDRGIARQSAETDASLSLRARRLPDTISPAAVLRLLHTLLDPYGIPFNLVETFQHSYQEAWDAPSPNIGTPTYQATPPLNPDFDDTTFVYDDPRDPDLTFRNRWLDEQEFRGAFIVVIDLNFTLRDLGFAYDDPGDVPLDFHPATGRPFRQTPAYDVSSVMPPENVYGPAYDGFDIDQRFLIASLWNSLQQVRAAGVAAIIDYVRP